MGEEHGYACQTAAAAAGRAYPISARVETSIGPACPQRRARSRSSSKHVAGPFTDQARQVLAKAEEEARGLNHNYVGTEHLLLGLISQGNSPAATVLGDLGIVLSRVRAAVEHIIGRGEARIGGEIGLTPRALAATALAVSEAGRVQRYAADWQVGPEHLLLGLLREGEGIAAGVLESLGATLDRVRAQTLEAILFRQMAVPQASAAPGVGPSPARSNVVTCRIGGHDLDAIDALVEAGVRSTRSDAAAWLIHAGIEANRALLDTVNGTVAEICRLREVAQGLAAQVAIAQSAPEAVVE